MKNNYYYYYYFVSFNEDNTLNFNDLISVII
jgi:hypothetical protein